MDWNWKYELSPFGPTYNIDSETLHKHRRRAHDGIKDMPRAMIVAYADAVEAAVLSAQRASLMREIAVPACPCASGTWHSDGEKIAESIRGRQRRALLSYPAQVRRRRTPKEWQHMYDQAMREKRKRTKPCLSGLNIRSLQVD